MDARRGQQRPDGQTSSRGWVRSLTIAEMPIQLWLATDCRCQFANDYRSAKVGSSGRLSREHELLGVSGHP